MIFTKTFFKRKLLNKNHATFVHVFRFNVPQVNDLYDNAKPLLKWVSKSSKNNQENKTDSKPNLAKKNVPTATVAPSRLQNISTQNFSTPSFIPDVLKPIFFKKPCFLFFVIIFSYIAHCLFLVATQLLNICLIAEAELYSQREQQQLLLLSN